jgi:Tryptophan-associated transmembrane protein (Trp_oprn_chp)
VSTRSAEMTDASTDGETAPRGRRLRLATIGGMLLLHALTLAVWTGTWITGQVQDTPLAVGGDAAAPALPALALCGLALAAALTIAGPVFRAVLAVLQVLLGVSIALSGILVVANPAAAAAPAVTARTGISGSDGVAGLLDAAAATALPFLAIALGAGSAALGVLLLLTSRRWPARSSRFSAVRAEAVDGGSIEEWDALSGGDDPTAR